MYRNKYYFNDGMDGIVVAKNIKHACKLLCKAIYNEGFNEIYSSVKLLEKDPYNEDADWAITDIDKVKNEKCRVVGFNE